MSIKKPFNLTEAYEKGKIYAITADDGTGNRILVCDQVFSSRSEAKNVMADYDSEEYLDLKVASFKPSLC